MCKCTIAPARYVIIIFEPKWCLQRSLFGSEPFLQSLAANDIHTNAHANIEVPPSPFLSCTHRAAHDWAWRIGACEQVRLSEAKITANKLHQSQAR